MIGYNPVGLCGTIDRVCKINGSLWILDIKSGKSYKGYQLQTAGYKLLIQPNYKEDIRRACIYFDKNNYVFVEHDDIQDEITFRAILQVYKWKKNKL